MYVGDFTLELSLSHPSWIRPQKNLSASVYLTIRVALKEYITAIAVFSVAEIIYWTTCKTSERHESVVHLNLNISQRSLFAGSRGTKVSTLKM